MEYYPENINKIYKNLILQPHAPYYARAGLYKNCKGIEKCNIKSEILLCTFGQYNYDYEQLDTLDIVAGCLPHTLYHGWSQSTFPFLDNDHDICGEG